MYERIRELREDADLKQKDMAAILKLHQTTYSSYELGKLNVPAPVLIQLAQFFHTSVDYLLGLTAVDPPYPPAPRRRTSGKPEKYGRRAAGLLDRPLFRVPASFSPWGEGGLLSKRGKGGILLN